MVDCSKDVADGDIIFKRTICFLEASPAPLIILETDFSGVGVGTCCITDSPWIQGSSPPCLHVYVSTETNVHERPEGCPNSLVIMWPKSST